MSITGNKFTKEIALDVYSSDLQVITAQQGDKKSRFVKIAILANGEPMTFLSGMSAVLKGHRADGQVIYDSCRIENNAILIELTEAILAVEGDCVFNIGFYGTDNSLLSTIPFKVHVTKNPYDENEIVATPIFSALTDALNKVNQAIKDAQEVVRNSADKIEQMDRLKDDLTSQMDDFDKAEQGREQAEAARNEAFDQAIKDAEQAADNANEAAKRVDDLADQYDHVDENFVHKNQVGAPDGVASLDGDGKVPLEQLPEITSGKTSIYVSEQNPDGIEEKDHWFKIWDLADGSFYEDLFSDLYPRNVRLANLDEAVGISWTDPQDSSWEGTRVMRKRKLPQEPAAASRAQPSSGSPYSGWSQVLRSTVKNQYSQEAYVDQPLINGVEYVYGIFPYSKIEENTETAYSIIPSEIRPNPLYHIACEPDTNSLTPSFEKDGTVKRVMLVYREGSVPQDIADGTAIDNFQSGTAITGLTNDVEYGLRFFVYNEKGRCNDSMEMAITATPKYTIHLTVPETLEITQGQTLDLSWQIRPEAEKANVAVTASSGLTVTADKMQLIASEDAPIGNGTVTFTIGDITKEIAITVARSSYKGLVQNISIVNVDKGVYVQFTKPSDALWVAFVQNEDHMPVDETDGKSKKNYVTGKNGITYFYQDAEPGKKYYYALFPCNGHEDYNYDPSQTMEFTTSPIYPSVPTDFTAEIIDDFVIRTSYTIPSVPINDRYPGAQGSFYDPRIPYSLCVGIRIGAAPQLNSDATTATDIICDMEQHAIGSAFYGYTLNGYSVTGKKYSAGEKVITDFYVSGPLQREGTFYAKMFVSNLYDRLLSLDSNQKTMDMNWSKTISDYAMAGNTTYVLDGVGHLYVCGSNSSQAFGNGADRPSESSVLTKIVYPNANSYTAYANRFHSIDGCQGGDVSSIIARARYGLYEDKMHNSSSRLPNNVMVTWPGHSGWGRLFLPNNNKHYTVDKYTDKTQMKSILVNFYGISAITEGNYLITAGDADLLGVNNNFSKTDYYGEMTSSSQYIANTKMSDVMKHRRYRIDLSGGLYEWARNRTSGTWKAVKSNISKVSCGMSHALIIDTAGNLYAAGDNMDTAGYATGVLGIFTNATLQNGNYIINNEAEQSTYSDSLHTYEFRPVMGGTKFKDIACGFFHSLAIDANGGLWAFGKNQYGQLGDGTSNTRLSPVRISSGKKFVSVKAKCYNSSARDADGNVWVWGKNDFGQLGNGTKSNSHVPALLKIPAQSS